MERQDGKEIKIGFVGV